MDKKKEPIGRIERKLDALAGNLEKSNFKDYVEYIHNRKRMYRNAFILGIFRGLGTAVGFTLLGALVVYLLQALAKSSIPLIGDFISEIVKIVDSKR